VQEFVKVTGMVLYAAPVNEYDKRIKILTKERGKITAFAKGARRPNSRFLAATNPFSFGTFSLFEGKTAYNLMEGHISNYFEEMRTDYEAAFYGMYFLDVADYYTRENNDETEMLKLLYQSLRALMSPSIPNELVQYIFEMKAIVVNGEFPGIPRHMNLLPDTRYTIEFVANTPLEHLYTFTVSKEVLKELADCADYYREHFLTDNLKSLEILKNCRLKM
jgi:DNA repair protein RecO (recombination protein O)